MSHVLICLAGAQEHSLRFDDPEALEEYAATLSLRHVATYRSGGDTVHQYFEPDFDSMGREDRERYSFGG